MWLPLNSTNECVIIINHQTFKFLIPQHTVTRIFISSEDALSLLLLFVSPSFLSPSPVCCCVLTFCIVPRRRRGMRGSLTTGSPTSLGGLPPPRALCRLPKPAGVALGLPPSSTTPVEAGDPCQLSPPLPHPFLVP